MLRSAVSRFVLATRQSVPTSASRSSSFFLTQVGSRLVSTHATAPSNEVFPSATSTTTDIPPFDPNSSANTVTATATVASALNDTQTGSGPSKRREKAFRPKRVKCFLCNQRGHVAKFCPTAAEVVSGEVAGQGEGQGEGKEVAEVPEVCFNCGQKGHVKSDCPEPKRCWHCGSTGVCMHSASDIRILPALGLELAEMVVVSDVRMEDMDEQNMSMMIRTHTCSHW